MTSCAHSSSYPESTPENIRYFSVRHTWNQSIMARALRTFCMSGRPFVHIPTFLWSGDFEKAHGWMSPSSPMFHAFEQSHVMWGDSSWSLRHDAQTFSWMDDVRMLADNQSRRMMRTMITSWIKHHRSYQHFAWSAGIVGERLSQWLQHFEFFGQSADEDFLRIFYKSVWHQFLYLKVDVFNHPRGLASIKSLKGIVMYALAYDLPFSEYKHYFQRLIQDAQDLLSRDGFIKTTHPDQQFNLLKDLITVRNLLRFTHHGTEAAYLQQTITRMVPPLRFFRHGDGNLSYLCGLSEQSTAQVDSVLALSDVKGRYPQRSEDVGLERIHLKNNIALVRTRHYPFPSDSSGNLQMEWSHRKTRLIKLCDLTLEDKKGHAFLSRSMAHVYRVQSDDHVFMELKLNDIHHMHNREIYMGDDVDMRVVERIRLNQKGYGALRFVIHSDMTIVSSDQKSVIMSMNKKEKYCLHFFGIDVMHVSQGSCFSEDDHTISALFEMHSNAPKDIKWSFSRV